MVNAGLLHAYSDLAAAALRGPLTNAEIGHIEARVIAQIGESGSLSGLPGELMQLAMEAAEDGLRRFFVACCAVRQATPSNAPASVHFKN
ncbi:hypothetical protein [Chelatococcus reniformis]|uniref:Uncharacterized protein n=1 Tax=Chelatococcus reniformis TaxID=1494448 RepID=A0A916U0K2_9HYPH|nr:hypothetical protein [Chelatococcus reniformis]GGC54609.1 hypothetical protein GCM10010994_11930 [Chelatococcus reniformis]